MLKCQPTRTKIIEKPKRSSLDEFIELLEKNLPEMPDTSDLIKFGIFPTANSAANNRRSGNCPEYIQINKRNFRYPKKSVIEWVRTKWISNKLAA